MKTIPLINTNLFTMVDDEDFEFLSQFRWGKTTKSRSSENYYVSSPSRKRIMNNRLMHRVIMCLQDKNLFVDHIDGNPMNNQKSNLRVCTRAANNANRTKLPHKRYKGVCMFVRRSTIRGKTYEYVRYKTQVGLNGVCAYAKDHKTELEAALDYNIQAKRIFGEYAKLNVIEKEDSTI